MLVCNSYAMLLALLRQYIRPYRGFVATLVVLQTSSTAASLYLPTLNASIIDDGIARGDAATILRLGLTMLGVTALQMACAVGAFYCGTRTGTGFGRDLRAAMFDRILSFSERETTRFGTATLLTRTTNDVRQIVFLVQTSATVLVIAPLTCIGGVVLAIRQQAELTWLLLVCIPVLAAIDYWIISRLLPLFRRMQQLIDALNKVLRDQLSGVRVIRAFTREPLERHRFAATSTALSATSLRSGNRQALLAPTTSLVVNLACLALIWFSGPRIDHGQMQVGSLAAFLAYFAQILMAVSMATMTAMVLPRAAICANRITEVLSTHSTVTDPAQPAFPTQGITGSLQLDAVAFRYPGADRPVLRDICLTASPGTTTAIVGSTGSGKSTLISLICRLHDVTGGAVLVDGIDVRAYQTERLWSAIGLVPQRGHLFTGTIADNLRYGARPDQVIDEAQMWAALRLADADEFVRAHPEGLEQRVAQGGINFSGGQRQRLAIARAVVRQPAIYLFDDAFSALDVHTEARIRSALAATASDSVTVIVTQRISTARFADQVIVIDEGRIAGAGSHESLLTECPVYAEFAASQSLAAR